MRLAFFVASLAIASQAVASERIPIDNQFLIGWTQDGNRLAYETTIGLVDPYPSEAWMIKYVSVLDAGTGKELSRYQIGASTTARQRSPKDWAAYLAAQPRSDWDRISGDFSKGPSSISNGIWTLRPKVTGDTSLLRLSTAIANGYDGELETERKIPGTVLDFEIIGPRWMQEDGKWQMHFDVSRDSKSVEVHEFEIVSSTWSLKGVPDGYIAAYWAPKGDGIALEYTYGPWAGGGEWTDFYYRHLPK